MPERRRIVTRRRIRTTPERRLEAVLRDGRLDVYNRDVGNVSVNLIGRVVRINGQERLVTACNVRRNNGTVQIDLQADDVRRAPPPPTGTPAAIAAAVAVQRTMPHPDVHVEVRNDWGPDFIEPHHAVPVLGLASGRRTGRTSSARPNLSAGSPRPRHERIYLVREREIMFAFYRTAPSYVPIGIHPDLPQGAEIKRVYHSPSRAAFEFLVEHPSFDEVLEGAEPPVYGWMPFGYNTLVRAEDGRYDLNPAPIPE